MKRLLLLMLVSALCACDEQTSSVNNDSDRLDQILHEQQFMNNQMEHQRRMQQYGRLHQ